MGFRFRRSVKIAPGVRWNFGKRSTSLSIGPRGAKLTLGSRGKRLTTSIPGTGLSFTQSLASESKGQPSSSPGAPVMRSAPMERTAATPNGQTFSAKQVVLVSSFAVLGLGVLAGDPYLGFAILAWLVLLLIGCLLPSGATLARRDLERRKGEFLSAVNALTSMDRPSIERVLALREELGLTEDQVGYERIEVLTGALSFTDFVAALERNGGKLEPVPGHERVVGTDSCFFAATAFLDKRGKDEDGELFLTDARLIFLGSNLTAVPWAKIVRADTDGRALVIQRADRQTPYRFIFGKYADALKSQAIAKALMEAPVYNTRG